MLGVIDDTRLENIATAIREKTGTEATYTAEEMPAGVNEVYEAGKTKEWSDFWDEFQDYGNRINYGYAFARAWRTLSFRPKYDIKPTESFECAFLHSGVGGNLKEVFENCGVVLDTSKATSMNQAFNNAYGITNLPEISFESSTSSDARIQGVFMGCYALKHIDKVIYPTDIHRPTTNTFQSCRALTHLRIGGVIGNNFNVSWCPLDVESVLSVITHLKDYSAENTGVYTLTLSDTSKTAMAELGAIEELNNKTYTEYLADIGWNLA